MHPLAFAALLTTFAAEPTEDAVVRQAVERGLKRLDEGAASYVTNRQCFSCHHQATTITALATARKRGFAVEKARLAEQVDFTMRTWRGREERLRKGNGSEGGNTMVAYALYALEQADYPPDETTAALVEYLLERQRPDGSWPALANRPPTEGSPYPNAALALRGLQVYGPAKEAKEADELRSRIAAATAKARDWLLKSKPATTEDRVGHLRALVVIGAEKEHIATARDVLLKAQRDDGGWAQLPDLGSDAYATGTVLVALKMAGVRTDDAAYRRGVAYLVRTQRADGAWIVETRSRPVQKFFDNGDPGGKSQFISFAATGWATLALLEAVPTPEEPK
jgi:squalene cyclase